MAAKGDIAVMRDGTTIRLAPGRHPSPGAGVCVVELASVIAGEEFSDRPRCVCPVIGAFLRGWNDRAAHAERQRLSPYAARIIGSRGSRRGTRERREICLQWAGAELRRGRMRRLLSRARMRFRIAVYCGLGAALRPNEGAGDYAARVAFARRDPESAFALLDRLLASAAAERGTRVVDATGNGHRGLNGNGRPAAPGRDGVPGLTSNGSGTANGRSAPPERVENGSANGNGASPRPKVTTGTRH